MAKFLDPLGVSMNEPITKKVYYSMGEVCDLTGLKPHVLRYWETQFEVLRLTKNRAGNRVFRSKEIEVIMLVKKLLYEQKYTIEGANKKLLEMRSGGTLEEERRDVLDAEVLRGLKTDLLELKELLSHGGPREAD